MSNTRSTRQLAENAILAYVAAGVTEGSPLDDLRFQDGSLPLFAAHSGADFALPCVVVECPKAMEMMPGSGWYEIDVNVHVFGSMDEIVPDPAHPADESKASKAEVLHPARVSQVLERLNLLTDGLVVPLNKPEVGEDTREVKGFTCWGAYSPDDTGDQEDAHFFDVIRLTIQCMPYDPTP